MTVANNFETWDTDAPVVAIGGESEFSAWDNEAPLVDFDESYPGVIRRQVQVI